MKKQISFIIVAAGFLIHCGGADVGPRSASAEQNQAESDSGSIVVPEIKNAAISVITGTPQIAIDAGYAGNGSTVSLPSGFTAAQCKFTAAVANVDGASISTYVSINSTTGVVTCTKVVQEREEVPATTKDCVASYTLMCVK